MTDDNEARMDRVDESLAKQLQKSIELNAQLAAEIKELKSRKPVWVSLSVTPTKSGKYLVGHRGWQELLYYFGPDKEWVFTTPLGWHQPGKYNAADDPMVRFRATHYIYLDPIIEEMDPIKTLMDWAKP